MSRIVTPGVDETDPFLGGPRGYTANYSDKDKLKCSLDNIRATVKWREDQGFDDTWKRCRDLYRLKADAQGFQDDDSINVAIAFATINVIAPSVSVNHPKITVTAAKEEDQDAAVIVEAVVNYWWRHYDFQPEFRRAVKDFLVYGLGIIKVGYRYEEMEREATQDERGTEIAHATAQLDDFAAENPDMAPDLPSDSDVVDAIPLTTIETVHDAPFVERISPLDFFIDPEATCLDDAKFIFQRVVLPLDRVKEDLRYETKARNAIKADSSVKWQVEDEKSHVSTPRNGRVTLWEYYDCDTKEFSVFVDQNDIGFLVKPQPYPYPFGLPFVTIENYDVPDQFYPIGDLEALEPLQYELNETRSNMVRARKLSIAKFIARKGVFDQTAKDAIGSDTPYSMAEADSDRPLNDLLIPLPTTDANAQLYTQHSGVIEADINLVSGVSDYQRGGESEIRRTATEASIIQDASNARASDKLAIIEGAISQIARRLVGLAQHYLDTEQAATIVGPAGTTWIKFTSTDIEGEFDFTVEGGSTQPQNETFRRQQSMQLLQVMQPFIQMGVINVQALLTNVLREGFGIKNPESFIQEPPPPVDPMTGAPIDPATGQPAGPPPEGSPDAAGSTPPGEGTPQGVPPEAQGQEDPMTQLLNLTVQAGGVENLPPEVIQGVPPEILKQIQEQYHLLTTEQAPQ